MGVGRQRKYDMHGAIWCPELAIQCRSHPKIYNSTSVVQLGHKSCCKLAVV